MSDLTKLKFIPDCDIKRLKPYKRNPRENDQAVEAVAKSIEEFGFNSPIIVNENYEICVGHTRVKAAIRNKITKVPVIVAPHLVGDKFTGYNIADNQTATIADWNDIGLAEILKELEDSEFDMSTLGFDEDELDEILAGLDDQYLSEGLTGLDDVPPKPKEAETQPGDIWLLGRHRLLCGDSTNMENIEKLMSGQKAKLCFTSPPYNIAGNMYRNYSDNLKSEAYIDFNITVIQNIKKILAGFIFWNISYNKNARWEWIEIFYRIIKETGLKFLENVIWDKGHGIPVVSKKGLTRQYENILVAGTEADIQEDFEYCFIGTSQKEYFFNKKTLKGLTNYWRIGTNKVQREDHKACFPVALPTKAIYLMTQRGDNVIDPFAGSGSTLISCEQTGRNFYGLELDPLYCDVIVKRWEDFTGMKSERIPGSAKCEK